MSEAVNLGRKGRPPRAEEPQPGRFVIGYKGVTYRFRKTVTGWFQLQAPKGDSVRGEDVDYLRAVLGRDS